MRNVLKGIALGTVVLALCATAALAEGPGYRYVEGGYLNVDVDDLNGSGDNYFLGGSFGGEWWHVNGTYTSGDLADDVELQIWDIAVGWHGLLGDKADVVAEAAYVDQEIEFSSGSDNDTGYRVTGGVRWVPFKLLELDGFVNYGDVSDSDVSYEARAIINIWRLGFGAAFEKFDDSDQWNAFVRFNFGR